MEEQRAHADIVELPFARDVNTLQLCSCCRLYRHRGRRGQCGQQMRAVPMEFGAQTALRLDAQ